MALARALINKPAVVLADEPTGNLDSKNSEVVLGMLRRSNQELGQTVLMITHNPEAASVRRPHHSHARRPDRESGRRSAVGRTSSKLCDGFAGPRFLSRDVILNTLSKEGFLNSWLIQSHPNQKTPKLQIREHLESFGEILSQFQKSHSHKTEDQQATSGHSDCRDRRVGVLRHRIQIGRNSSPDALCRARWSSPGTRLWSQSKDAISMAITSFPVSKLSGRWIGPALEKAFAEKSAVLGTVTAVVKGGFSVDVGVRAFMPASRSGVREAAEMEKLVGQEIRCRIIKLDVADEDVVVDRRALAEEEERAAKDNSIRSDQRRRHRESEPSAALTDYGAFVDLGGVDALLHVGEIPGARVNKPADVLSVGQQVEVKVLKLANEGDKRRISVGMKQLQPHPWDAVGEKFKAGDRVRGTVTRLAEFGAFVELEARHGRTDSYFRNVLVEGQIRKASDVVKPGETVEVVILAGRCSPASALAWTEAGTGRSVGRSSAALPTRIRGRGTRHQPDEIRRLHAGLRRSRGHDPRQRNQCRKADQSSR